MDKKAFIERLKTSLSGLPQKEINEIVADYEEHYAMAKQNGETELATSEKLGNPKIIGKSYKVNDMLKSAGEGKVGNLFKAVFATLSLGLFNIIFIVGPFFGLIAIIVSLWASAFAVAISGVVCVIGGFVAIFVPIIGLPTSLVGFGVIFLVIGGIGATALGLLFGIGMYFATKWFIKIIIQYVQFNVRIASGK